MTNAFVKQLVESTESAASAYIQFIQEVPLGEFSAYVFVEDRPDVEVYRHFLSHLQGLAFYTCGGKGGVVAIRRKLESDGVNANVRYIVDRDTDQVDDGSSGQISTIFYSWESHLCESDAVLRLISHKSHPAFLPSSVTDIESNWQKSLDAFKALLAQHAGLILLSSREHLELGVGDIPICKDSSFEDGVLIPGEAVQVWLDSKAEEGFAQGLSAAELGAATAAFFQQDAIVFARGKTLFGLLKTFLARTHSLHQRSFLGDLASAVRVAQALPSDWPAFQYVRTYIETEPAG